MASDSSVPADERSSLATPADHEAEVAAAVAANLSGVTAASDDEAAAISAAISAHLSAQEAAAAASADDDGSSRRTWQFAGRLAAVGLSARRPPTTTPTDSWTAASRADRF